MAVNKEALELIKHFEGVRLTAYPDPGSKDGLPWTIGYGHTKGVKKGDKITMAQAEQFLKEDLAMAEAAIKKHIKVPLNENQYGALVSFIHNVGETQFARGSVKRYINERRFAEVPGRLALYRMNDGKIMQGLVRRRAAEGELWMKPVISGLESSPKEIINEQIKEAQGKPAQPAKTKKPWDWGAIGGVVTFLAAQSDAVKKLVGNVTSTFGVPPISLLIVAALAFAGWTIYSKWNER